MKLGLHRTDCGLHPNGHFRELIAVDLMEHEHSSSTRRQSTDCSFQIDAVRRRRGSCRQVVQFDVFGSMEERRNARGTEMPKRNAGRYRM